MASARSYPPSYPAGVFVVRSKQELAPLVARLRAARRLKPGRNVTVFDGEHFAEVADALEIRLSASAPEGHGGGATEDAACGLRETLVHLRETTEAEAVQLVMATQTGRRTGLSGNDGISALPPTSLFTSEAHLTSARASAPAVMCERCALITARDSVEGEEFLSLLRVPCAERAGTRWPLYMAAHVVGEFAETELRALLSSDGSSGGPSTESDGADGHESMKSSTPVAYIRGVRRFHRVCCPVLAEMPSALAAMRRAALLQRHHRLAQRDEAAADSPCASPSSEAGAPSLSAATLQRSSAPPGGLSRDANTVCSPFFTFSELFGGIGMFRSGLERVGGRAAFAVEFAPPAQIVYALNHRCLHDCPAALQLPNAKQEDPGEDTRGLLTQRGGGRLRSGTALSAAASAAAEDHAAMEGGFPDATARSVPFLVGDITEIPSAFFPTHDVLTGGFPCQSFAKAGDAAGLHADKGWLFYEVVRVLAATRPTAFLLENVEHLVEVEAGAQLAVILARLRRPASALSTPTAEDVALEYEVQHVVVDGGALTPQTRKRVYFFGFRAASPLVPARAVPLDRALCQSALPRADDGEASAAAARVVADALQRIKAASLDSPYRIVQELLVAPSTVDLSYSTPQGRSIQDEPTSTSHGEKSAAHSSAHGDLQLTSAQWEAVRRSRTYRQNPLWRLCDVQGRARTLLGSYRTSYQLYSEFVPFSSERTQHEVVAMLLEKTPLKPGDDADDVRAGGSENPAIPAPPPPPLRFFALRECARLQGIEDTFLLPHDTTQLSSSADGATPPGAAVIPAAVLRQVPSGAVYKLIGNAVNPRVVACLGGAIASYLQERRR
ncbi:cytosine-specific DNA methylase / DMMT6 [Leishmania donovani]|uniref:DNA (cytosine-5-)-methyltransferase n=1 Tax=Leishmania donovani TaxID=5661 RepID=A0A6J8FDA2_LEIDO|nr:cytosine-specific DNA methylase / DMMT6 [Leishmania donovani]VDZ45316.1 modification_methylase-like_protein/GeneDB:LmjF.25.1200 [Leishmania donovani]